MTAVPARTLRTTGRSTSTRSPARNGARPAAPRTVTTQTTAARAATRRAARPTTLSSTRFGGLIISVFIGGMLLSLFINTFAERAAFRKHELQVSIAQATALRQKLESEVAAAESPDHLLEVAQRMGMVPAATPVFLRLSDHRILGKRVPAKAGG